MDAGNGLLIDDPDGPIPVDEDDAVNPDADVWRTNTRFEALPWRHRTGGIPTLDLATTIDSPGCLP